MPNNALINDFMFYLVENDCSTKTVNGYTTDLTVFFRFLRYHFEADIDLDKWEDIAIDTVDIDLIKQVKHDTILAFLDFLNTRRGNKETTLRRKLASLSDFFVYLSETCFLVEQNPVERIHGPKSEPSQLNYLSLKESVRLLKAIDGMHQERDYAIIMLFLTCGLKLSEVCNLTCSDYDGDILRIRGERGKERRIHINKSCQRALADYLAIRDTIKSYDGSYLFLSSRKTGLKRRSVHQLVQKHLKAADLDTSIYSAQSLRHTCAMLLFNKDQDLAAIHSILGNTSSSVTARYARSSSSRQADLIDRHPLNDI